jgi:hypothetical protein
LDREEDASLEASPSKHQEKVPAGWVHAFERPGSSVGVIVMTGPFAISDPLPSSAGPRPAATLPALPASHRIATSPPAEPASPTNAVSTGRSLDAATTASTRLHCIIDSSEHDCTPVISRAARRTLLPAFMSEAPEHTSKPRQCRKMSSLFVRNPTCCRQSTTNLGAPVLDLRFGFRFRFR